jgi:OFA family oxalate/formate antiporter-like MFS transporter
MQKETRSGRLAQVLAMGGLCLSGFLAFGVGVYSFTQFLEPLAGEFGWDRATVGGMMSAFWLSAPFAVVAGYLLPRLGIRRVVLVGAIVETVSLAGTVIATNDVQFLVLRFAMGVGKLFIVTPLPIMAARWFPIRPGVAIAIALCGWHVGGLALAPLSAWLIALFGWRVAALILAALLITGMILAVANLRDPAAPSAAEPLLSGSNRDKPLARNTTPISVVALIAVGLGTLAFYAGYAGLLSQLSPLLADCGFGPQAIGRLTGSVAICAAIGVLAAGAVTQVARPRIAGAVVLLLMGLTAVVAVNLGPAAGTVLPSAVVILLGVLVGGGDPILIESLRRAIPDRYFGQGYGWWYLLCLTALALAPVLTGAAFDHTGSYHLAFLTIGGLCLGATAIWLAILR